MKPAQAIKALGANAKRADVARTAAALQIHPWNNSAEESERLAAAQWALANWRAYQAAADAARMLRAARDSGRLIIVAG